MPVLSTRSLIRLAALAILGLSCATGCKGTIGGATGDDPPISGPRRDPNLSQCRQQNETVYLGLWSSCQGCHAAGSNRPYFADLESFERLIAYSGVDPLPGASVYVRAGDPAGSELINILAGTSSTYATMPPGAQSYSDLVTSGNASGGIPIADIEQWIQNLEVCELPTQEPNPVARRLSAEMIRAELQRQLAITDSDMVATDRPIANPDDSPPRVPGSVRARAHNAWQDLGGAHYLNGTGPNNTINEPLVQSLFPLAQAWCANSVRNKDILFRPTLGATKNSSSTTSEAAIKANIQYMFLHMLGEMASFADVVQMYDTVFVPTELQHDPPTAWTAVCSALVRDPLWITF